MYNYLILLLLLCQGNTLAQQAANHDCTMTVSPVVNQADPINKLIITGLCKFLNTKNDDLTANEYWDSKDFSTYIYPYLDIFNIEQSKYGKDFYKPTLLELVPTMTDQKIVKIAFIGHNEVTNENQIKCIYNMMANIQNGKVVFSKYLSHATADWSRKDAGSLHYRLTPQRSKPDSLAVQRQLNDIVHLTHFFGIEPIDITYYSCKDAIELFRIKGFDYNPSMYLDTKGGLADYGNIVYSANDTEYYTHEVTHIYTNKICVQPNKFIDEGLAMCFGGSGMHDFEWHKNRFKNFLHTNPSFNMKDHLDIYERTYIDNDTPIPYVIAALICQRALRLYDKNVLTDMLKSNENTDVIIAKIGLSIQGLHDALISELQIDDFKIYNY